MSCETKELQSHFEDHFIASERCQIKNGERRGEISEHPSPARSKKLS